MIDALFFWLLCACLAVCAVGIIACAVSIIYLTGAIAARRELYRETFGEDMPLAESALERGLKAMAELPLRMVRKES